MSELNPANTICVCYANGKEVGRIAATSPRASAYIKFLAATYNGLEVKYEEDKDEAMFSRLFTS